MHLNKAILGGNMHSDECLQVVTAVIVIGCESGCCSVVSGCWSRVMRWRHLAILRPRMRILFSVVIL